MRALVLNRHWIPVNVVSWEDAFTMLFAGRAYFLDHESFIHYDMDDWIERSGSLNLPKVNTTRCSIAAPEVLLLREYQGIPGRRVKYSKMNVFYRDKFICQYCGQRFGKDDLTIDHVLPRSKGGKSTWGNVVTACVSCNRKKDDRTPEQAGMKLLRAPKEPAGTNPLFCLNRTDSVLESWKKFLFSK